MKKITIKISNTIAETFEDFMFLLYELVTFICFYKKLLTNNCKFSIIKLCFLLLKYKPKALKLVNVLVFYKEVSKTVKYRITEI